MSSSSRFTTGNGLKPFDSKTDSSDMIATLFFIFTAKAEYRAFELNITNQVTNQSRVVTSNLDHIQYPMYYHIGKDEQITIAATWMCRGPTPHFEPICPKPAPQAQAVQPAPPIRAPAQAQP